MSLLGFSPDGQGRAIIAAGNPDTADNVVAYVPGMGTYLSDHFVSKDVLHAQNIAVAAGQANPSHATSAVIWLGYDAPQVTGGAADWAHELDITGTGDADAGAAAYRHFLTGLRATNTSSDLNLTALGHSYGSVLVGRASQLSGGLDVNNVVIVGTPAWGSTTHRSSASTPAAYGRQLPKRPVPKLNYGTSAGEMAIPIVGAYWSMLDDHKGGGWFGENPADAKFGANRFTVPIGGTGGLGMQAHGQYFDWSDSRARLFTPANRTDRDQKIMNRLFGCLAALSVATLALAACGSDPAKPSKTLAGADAMQRQTGVPHCHYPGAWLGRYDATPGVLHGQQLLRWTERRPGRDQHVRLSRHALPR